MLGLGTTPAFHAQLRAAGGAASQSPAAVNLVPDPVDASLWNYLNATWSGPLGFNATAGYPGYAIHSAGAYFHRASYLQRAGFTGDAFAITLLVRAGSSGRVRLWVRNLDTGTDRNISGTVDVFGGTSGPLEVVSNTVQADGVTRAIVARYTQEADGVLDFAIGPHSNAAGEDVIVIGAQVEAGLVAHPFTA